MQAIFLRELTLSRARQLISAAVRESREQENWKERKNGRGREKVLYGLGCMGEKREAREDRR